MHKRSLLLVSTLLLAACGGGSSNQSVQSVFVPGQEEDLLEQALEQRRVGDTNAAALSLQGALQANPMYLAAHLELGNLELERGNLDASFAAYARSVELRDRTSDGHLGLARVTYRQSRLPEALTHATRAVETAVSSGSDWMLADALVMQANVELALGQAESASATLARALEADSTNVAARIAQARLLSYAGNVIGAVQAMARAESFEEDPLLLREMGILYYDMRVDDRSIEATERALERAPNDDIATYYLASARMRSGQRDVAIQIATDLIRRNPEFLGAYIVRGRGELLRNYLDRAADDVQFVLQRDPSSYDALVLKGDLSQAYARQTAPPVSDDLPDAAAPVYNAAGTAHLNEAVLSYQQALAINPNGFEAADHLGDVLFSQLNWQAYIDLIEPRLRGFTTGASWRERLAQAYLATGRLNDCLLLRSEVALEQPSNAELNLGVARLALDNEGHAMAADVVLRHASAAYQNSNRSLEYILVIVDAYLNENNCTQATNYLETAVRAFPSNPDVRRRMQALDDCP